MPGRSARRSRMATRFVSFTAFSTGVLGSILMIISAGSLTDMPAEKLCEQQGFPASDCTAPNQTIFFDPLAPPCCIGFSNASETWARPAFVDISQVEGQLACSDKAESARAGIQVLKPPPKAYGHNGKYTAADLSRYYDNAFEACLLQKMEDKYYFLWQPGVVSVFAVLMSAGAHATGAEWMAALGTLLSTSNAAIISSAVSVAEGLGWQTGIQCSDLPHTLISNGMYMETFPCYDFTVGGRQAVDPGYAYLHSAWRLYMASAVLCVASSAIYVVLLALKILRQREARGKEIVRDFTLNRDLLSGAAGGYHSDRERDGYGVLGSGAPGSGPGPRTRRGSSGAMPMARIGSPPLHGMSPSHSRLSDGGTSAGGADGGDGAALDDARVLLDEGVSVGRGGGGSAMSAQHRSVSPPRVTQRLRPTTGAGLGTPPDPGRENH